MQNQNPKFDLINPEEDPFMQGSSIFADKTLMEFDKKPFEKQLLDKYIRIQNLI